MKFYHSAWASFETAKPGSLRLLPTEHHRNELVRNYGKMKGMIFGAIPTFEEIEAGLSDLENAVNALKKPNP